MKILFLSDLHLGSPLFRRKAEILNILKDEYDKIIVVGDLLDVWYKSAYDIYRENEDRQLWKP